MENDFKRIEIKPEGGCFFYSALMALLDPDLTLIKGSHSKQHIEDTAHFWVRNKKGEDIDPTASQYEKGQLLDGKPIDVLKNIDYVIKDPLFKTIPEDIQKKIRFKSGEKMEKSEIRKLIWKAKRLIQKEPAFLEICKKYDMSPDFVEDIKVSFEPLDVSAKTVNGEIILNEKLLQEDMREIVKYLLHEAVHCEQQEAGEVNEKTQNKNYLDDRNEQEAFQTQLKLMKKYYTDEEIQIYIENLLDHHSIKGQERKEKERLLTKKI